MDAPTPQFRHETETYFLRLPGVRAEIFASPKGHGCEEEMPEPPRCFCCGMPMSVVYSTPTLLELVSWEGCSFFVCGFFLGRFVFSVWWVFWFSFGLVPFWVCFLFVSCFGRSAPSLLTTLESFLSLSHFNRLQSAATGAARLRLSKKNGTRFFGQREPREVHPLRALSKRWQAEKIEFARIHVRLLPLKRLLPTLWNFLIGLAAHAVASCCVYVLIFGNFFPKVWQIVDALVQVLFEINFLSCTTFVLLCLVDCNLEHAVGKNGLIRFKVSWTATACVRASLWLTSYFEPPWWLVFLWSSQFCIGFQAKPCTPNETTNP